MRDTTGANSTESPPAGLRRHLTVVPATALAVTTVIGGGALVLPGAALREAGNDALLGWVLAAVITLPLIFVFARLGAGFPSAGGIAGFAGAGFGRISAAGVEVVLIGTFGLGIPAIALSGGGYLAAALNWPASQAWIGAVVLLLPVAAMLTAGTALSARVQTVLAAVLTAALLAVGALGLFAPGAQFSPPDFGPEGWGHAFTVVGIVFFGFTGWEMIAFTTGEYRDPRRDFPRVVALSFLIVIGVYLLLAAGVQAVLDPSSPRVETAPLAELVETAFSPTAATLVSVLGVLILAANLVGAVWGASRLVYSSADQGLLPRSLAAVSRVGGVPRRAVLATVGLFLLVVLCSATGLITVTGMFEVAGQNFFLLYVLCAAVYGKVADGAAARAFGIVLAVCLLVVALVGFDLITIGYPMALFAAGAGVGLVRGRWT
ncbi:MULTISPECIES: APC family permease [unclassified Saccharopolyspora]|uniref:APC family permease n=1 Tax=unclassified Saccharopolyspora TaxID=2646250 RepID=UPI001CD2B2CA|nr:MULTISPECIES: amino acid permease [unclassified Saccharopolyspora]MCA1186643.1 amino acid permease [Saccharopolyspora sp. 6T]MCA1281179.1 amino acid permease [Saccharopolyspora sp. 7B]